MAMLKGKVIIFLNGKEIQNVENLVVYSGLKQIIALMTGTSTDHFTAIAVGTGSTAVSSTQTALTTQVAIDTATVSVGTTSFAGDTAIFQASISFSTTYSLREMGIFSSTSSGIMLNRALINVPVVDGDTLGIAWQIIS